ncbi:MAG TPA: proline racemase family protein [Methylomirabilota bacterium]|nr:proline racemase family protein [Methylomirabilota bacterium]
MTPRRVLDVVDYHTEGEPMRIVRSGFPPVPGATMLERSRRFAAEHDELRRLVLFEPRGHAAMCAAFLVAARDPTAHAGVIFVEPAGVVHMCGHGAIAIATMLVETGDVAPREPETPVVLDTAAGRVTARVAVRDGQVGAATIRNVPAYSALLDASVAVPDLGRVGFDLAYGGHFYALVEAARLGLDLVPAAAARLVAVGEQIRAAVEAVVDLTHPDGAQAQGLVYVQFYGPPRDPRAHLRNVVVVAPAGLDRSPCGTGTSARLANLWARGSLAIGQEFVHESIIGTRFEARVVGTTRVGPRDAVVPEVTGRAYPAARSQLILRADDPFPGGFLL